MLHCKKKIVKKLSLTTSSIRTCFQHGYMVIFGCQCVKIINKDRHAFVQTVSKCRCHHFLGCKCCITQLKRHRYTYECALRCGESNVVKAVL